MLNVFPEGLSFLLNNLARSPLTPGCVHVAQKLLLNNQCRWFQDRTDPTGSLRSYVLAEIDKETSK
jgi:hypothetical protein